MRGYNLGYNSGCNLGSSDVLSPKTTPILSSYYNILLYGVLPLLNF